MQDTAIILAGAAAKGPFEAGVLEELARRRQVFHVGTVVGASAGALSAAVYAAGIRAGREATQQARSRPSGAIMPGCAACFA